MSTTFGELIAEVSGIVPGYSQFLARRDLLKSWRDIINARTWSFLIGEGGFNAPALINAGSVSVTENSANIIADVTAAAALQAAVAETPTLTLRQFRISAAGAIYNIISWTNLTRTLVVDRPILEETSTGTSYMVYQCYFPPPPQARQADGSYDFNRWISVVDPINGYALRQDVNKAVLDIRDPQRSDFDLAYIMFDYKNGAHDAPFYEFWPHPTQGQEYICIYKKFGLDFTTGNAPLPQMIPPGLIIDRCLGKYAATWAAFNAGRNPALQKTNWLSMKQDHDRSWPVELKRAMNEDDNVSLQTLIVPLRNKWNFGPIDSKFLQSHDAVAIW